MKPREFIYIAALVALALLLLDQCNGRKTLEGLHEARADSLRTSVNSEGQHEAEIRSFVASSKKDFLKLKSDDSTINWLQSTVKDYKGKLAAAVVVGGTTTSQGGSATTVTGGDTVIIGDTVYVYPSYATTWQNDWENGEINAQRDTIYRKIRIRNKYEFTLGKQNNGWFKKRETEILVTNLNPNTITTELRSYNLQQTPKRFGVIVYLGYGFSTQNISPQIGVGVGYTLISIK